LSELRKIPLFPLNTVLFPGMMLPLHIFEERYKLMIYRCVTENTPFGVVLIREGNEVGGGAKVYDIGTTAHITKIDPLDDGRMNIATLGFHRFKIHEFVNEEPYLCGLIEDFPLQEIDSPLAVKEASRLGPMLLKYLDIITAISDVDVKLDKLPDDAMTMAFLTAIVLRAPMEDKQALLNIPSLPAMLRSERKMLVREAQLMRFFLEHTPKWLDSPSPFSPN